MTLYKYCKRCGKLLKGEENRRRGYGKTCFQKIFTESREELTLIVPPSNYPIEITSETGACASENSSKSKGKSKQEAGG